MADHFDDGHGDEEHRAEFETQAREALTAQFVLDAIAAKEELSVGRGRAVRVHRPQTPPATA